MSEPQQQPLTLARHFIDVEQPERALSALQKVEGGVLESAEYFRLTGQAYLLLSKHEDAQRALGRGLAVDPTDIGLLHLMARAEMGRGDYAASERNLLAALAEDPENYVLLACYGELVARAGQFPKAHRLLAAAAERDPEGAEVARVRFVVATLEGKDKDARAHGDAWLAAAPDDPRPMAASGLTLGSQGRLAEGIERVGRAVSQDPRVIEGAEQAARQHRLMAHWSLLPLRPIHRFGAAPVFIVGAGLVVAAGSMGEVPGALVGLAWGSYCIYTWIAGAVVARKMKRS